MSYTTFSITDVKYRKNKVTVTIENTGTRDGDEVIQVYLSRQGDTDGPIKTLKAYKRITLKAGERRKEEIDLPRESFEWWDNATNTVHYLPGRYNLMVGNSSDASLCKVIKIKK